MKCPLCKRHQVKKDNHTKHVIFGILTSFVILSLVVIFTLKISNTISGNVVKEINYNPVCNDEIIDYLEYYYDYEDVEVCGKRPIFNYRIENFVAENSYQGKDYGISLTYDIVNLESKKINYCDSFEIYDDKDNLLAIFKEQCYLFAPGEKIERGGTIKYLLFPVNNVNYYDSNEFDFDITIIAEPDIKDCVIEKKVVKKYTEKQTSVCVCD